MRNIILNNHQFELLQESIKEKLAAERGEVNTNPSEGQCKAGNYKMGHISINGFEISIENPKGSYRKGKDRNGKEWKTLMHNDYGYFTKTVGKDGDAIDVFLGPYLDDKIEDAKIYPIDQFINGEFDETKVMMGFRDKESAKAAYLSNYEKDWKGFKYITEVDIETFKKWLYDGYRQRKPFAKYVSLTESINSMIKNNVEDILRKKVKEMVKDGSLSTDYSQEMAEHYNNIISKAFDINKDKVMDTIGNDDRYYHSIIDDEFEKCGGKYDTMDVEAHKKGIKRDLEKLHQKKITEMIKNSIYKELSLLSESKNNVNMNVELRKGGRNAVKMSEKEFEEELKALFEKYLLEEKPKYPRECKWSIGNFVYKCCYDNKKFEKSKILGSLHRDIWETKYKFDTENVEASGKIKMSSKGVPYIVCYAGGDWECPVCFILYFDGTKVRAYIPLKGNAINRNGNQAFGGSDNEAAFIAKELNISEEEAKDKVNDINFNEKACVEDFLSRIEVKGTYKAKDYSKLHEEFETMKKEIKNEEKEKKERVNDEGEKVPEYCDKCGGEVTLQIHGEPVYICGVCGKYFGTKPFKKKMNESIINEKFNSPKLAQLSKEHGGIEVGRNGGLRDGAKAWQRGNAIDLSKVTDDMIEGEPFIPERWSEQPNAICFNDGTMVKLKSYGEAPAPEKIRRTGRYGTGIGDTGDHERKNPQGQEYNPWGISQRAAEAHYGREAIQNNKNDIDYINNHKENYPNWQKLTYDANQNIKDIKGRVLKKLDEMKKQNPPKDEFAAIRKANREDEIKNHGRATALRSTVEKNPKAYDRNKEKENLKKDLESVTESKRIIRLTEEQFKNYCRTLLQEKRKKDYVKNILEESKWYDDERGEDFTPDTLGGNFEVWIGDSEEPITGSYTYQIKEEPQTYDYPGYSETILDNVNFNEDVDEELQERIKEEIEGQINNGEEGDLYIEF